ncbi:hypothetical protein ABFS82_05G074800 [Erythranthe guttata]
MSWITLSRSRYKSTELIFFHDIKTSCYDIDILSTTKSGQNSEQMISHSSFLPFFQSNKNLINNPGFDYVFGCICNSTFKNINCFFADANTRISLLKKYLQEIEVVGERLDLVLVKTNWRERVMLKLFDNMPETK